MKKVPRHKVLVAESKQDWFLHTTQRAIYSTLTNGTIKAELNEDGTVKLYTEKDKEITELTSKKKPKDKKEKVEFEVRGKSALFTPIQSKIKPLRLELERETSIGTKLIFSNSEEEGSDRENKIMEEQTVESPKITQKRKIMFASSTEAQQKETGHKKKKMKKKE